MKVLGLVCGTKRNSVANWRSFLFLGTKKFGEGIWGRNGIGKKGLCMGGRGKTGIGGFLLRFGWCRGVWTKRMLLPGFLFLAAPDRAKSG